MPSFSRRLGNTNVVKDKNGAKVKRKARSKKKRHVAEQRDAEVLTVAWIVCTGWSAAAQLVTVVLYACSFAPNAHRAVAVYAGWLLAVAAIIGLAAIVMTPIVLRRRRTKPPRSMVLGSLVVNALPVLILATLFVARGRWLT
jgi:hypothetical protein